MDLMDMRGKAVLISGGTSGIGLAAARLLLRAGAKVALLGRDSGRGKEALALLGQDFSPEHMRYIQGDVARRADCQRAVEETVAAFGRLDVLVNSAGLYREGALEEVTEEGLEEILSVNVKGTFWLTQAALPELKQRRGNVVNVASDAGVHGNYYCSAYCASKGAVVLFTRAMALELASFGVRVNAIAPGFIATDMTEGLDEQELKKLIPMGRFGKPEEVASVAAFLASSEAAYITGQVIQVNGGLYT